MYPTIEVPGRALSQAWLAVAAACGDDDKGPKGNYRTVNLEFFEYLPSAFLQHGTGLVIDAASLDEIVGVPMNMTGVRLTAANGRLMSQCWVPTTAAVNSDDFATEPGDSVVPSFTVTAIDDDYRIRDMMKYVAKEAKDSLIDVRLSIFRKSRPLEPTLSEEMDELSFKVEIPLRETLIVDTMQQGTKWLDWRKVMTNAVITEPTPTTVITGEMLASLGKIPKIADGDAVTIEWAGSTCGTWSIRHAGHTFSPHGILFTIRPDEKPAAL